jgi:cytochrome c oxidase assembly protein subunit 15
MANRASMLYFRHIGLFTLAAVYLVILAGSIVRASGAGMGCPDWPTCFGRWIPPTHESQLPADYHQIYAARGYQSTQFNPVKTWTEYINRLTGATTGFLVLLTVWAARVYLRSDKTVFYLALMVFFLISFQGWLGATVVASNLKPVMITLHMLMALLLVALLIYTLARSQRPFFSGLKMTLPARFHAVLIAAISMVLLQIAMGTQVREAVDFIAHEQNAIERRYWRDAFPIIFYVHRSFSSIILLIHAWLAWKIYRAVGTKTILFYFSAASLGLIVIAILAGVLLDRFGVPAFVQPIHLLAATLIFGIDFFLLICGRYAKAAGSELLAH